jgi:hypothetical protein
MATISKLSRLTGGVQRQVDLTSNELQVNQLIMTGGTNNLTAALVDQLFDLNAQSDADGTYDSKYHRKTTLASTATAEGASLIGVEDAGGKFTGTTVEAVLLELQNNIDAVVGDTDFADNVFRVSDEVDVTKKMAFDVGANVTTGTTRTLTIQDKDIIIAGTQDETFGGTTTTFNTDLDVNGNIDLATGQLHQAIVNQTASGDSAIDWDEGNVQQVTLDQNTTLTFSNGRDGAQYLLIVDQDGTGGYTLTLPGTVSFIGPAASIATGANERSIISFFYDADKAGSEYQALASNEIISMSEGGTGANLTPSLGSIVYTDSDSMELLAPGAQFQLLQSNGVAAPSWVSELQNITKVTLSSDAAPTANAELANKKYVDDQAALKLSLTGGTMSGNIAMGSNSITGLADPTAAQDAATKAYVDSLASGLDPKESVRAATTANLAGYAAGSITGLGASLSIDGISLVSGDRVLVKNQSDAKQNGIYTYDGTDQLDRASDHDGTPANEVSAGNFTFVEQGTQASTGWVLQGDGILTLDTDLLQWAQFSAAGAFTASLGVELVGNDFRADLLASGGLKLTGNEIGVEPADFAGTGLEDDGADNLRIAAQGNGLAGGAGSTLSVLANVTETSTVLASAIVVDANGVSISVDDSTIEGSLQGVAGAESLRVKDAGITLAKMASDSVDENKIVSTSYTEGIQGGSGAKVKLNVNGLVEETGIVDTDYIPFYDADAGLHRKISRGDLLGNLSVVAEDMVAGESFAANTSFLVRMAVNGETASRVYKADNDATSADNFYVVGVAHSTTAVSAGQTITVTKLGEYSLGSSDTAFTAASDEGKPVFLGAAGAFTLTAPTTADEAVVRIGTVRQVGGTSSIEISGIQVIGIN